MEFSITKGEFFKGLQKSQGVADTKGAIPILSNILIEVVDSGIWIYATDLNIGIKGFYKASVKTKGKFTINARKLFDIVRELPDADINVSQKSGSKRKEPEPESAELWINLSCGNYKTRLSGLPVDEFPTFPSYGEDYLVKFEPSQLKDMVKKTIFSISSDETRYTLNGTLLEADENTIKMVSTDGHRLSYIKNENPKTVEKKINVIIPQKTTSELLKLVEDGEEAVLFSIYENHVVFKKENFVLVSRVIDGQFPNYDVVLPKNNDKRVILNKDVLIHALKRVSLLSDEKSKMVKFNIEKDNIELISDTAGIGEAKEKIDVKYDGEGLSIGLNARYLLDIMSAVDSDEIFFDIKDPVSPTLFMPMNNENYKCVIMPMRLQ
ncbi:MAG: DNA polymerase III subunit beta [Nitrospinae bacterium RIFCSPLOWO2_01_FULL_39_10]|nr:MAG: DNA polymerase III subunit beta [Nitrospinae bacterium RIFCSPLOWO2_01_FULL_39_10]